MTYTEAANTLIAKGMVIARIDGVFSDTSREYWAFPRGNNVMGDHSATITHIGCDEFHISDFS